MNNISGRRNTGAAKRFGKALLEGLDSLGTAMNDGPKRARISEIDEQVKNLLQERDHLIHALYEPGDLKVSKSYDPNWRKPEDEDDSPSYSSSEGRLTKCPGRDTMSRYHRAHPGCPYVEQIHTAHEFTLRD